jgi:NADH dehydrogenase
VGTARVVIIGGGFGGLSAAQTLAGTPVDVTVIDRHNYHVFQPLLYQVATASLSPGDIASPIRWILSGASNIEVLLADVQSIDVANRRVVVNRGAGSPADSVPYDYVIVAAGASHAYFSHPEWCQRAPGLKTMDDALEMRREILLAFEAAEQEPDQTRRSRMLTFVIVGGGPTGVELAGALADIARRSLRRDFRHIRPESARILLVEGGPTVLAQFPEQLRRAATRSLERLGVEVWTSALVTDINADGVTLRSAGSQPGGDTTPRDVHIPAQTVLWAAGVAASPLGRSLGAPLDRAGRVQVEPGLDVPGHADVFVVGDLCAFEQDGKSLAGVAQVAIQEGRHAARNILRRVRGVAAAPFRYRDYGIMAVIGRGSAVADVFGIRVSGFFAWLFWLFLHIFWLIGFRNRIVVMGEWAWAYVTMQRRVRLITGGRLWPSSGT